MGKPASSELTRPSRLGVHAALYGPEHDSVALLDRTPFHLLAEQPLKLLLLGHGLGDGPVPFAVLGAVTRESKRAVRRNRPTVVLDDDAREGLAVDFALARSRMRARLEGRRDVKLSRREALSQDRVGRRDDRG